MASIKPQIADLARNTEATVDVDKIAVPFTTINNRAEIFDLSKIPAPKMGIERVVFKTPGEEKSGESGPNGETSYRVTDDRVRFYGSNVNFVNNSNGFFVQMQNATAEVTFYGTGLNILCQDLSSGQTFSDYTVDGVSQGSFSQSASNILNARGYQQYIIASLVSGLSQGWHTVTMTSTTFFGLQGFEILNETTQLSTSAGNVSGELVASQSLAFDSGFTIEQGTAGTKGGHVVVYNENNQTKKAIRYVDTTQGNLGSADHSNEEVTARHHWRSFGAGRADDFSTVDTAGPQDAAFTLDDGTTTLVGDDVYARSVSGGLSTWSVGNSFTLTFVGTGLDIINQCTDNPAAVMGMQVYVDGVLEGTHNSGTGADGGGRVILPIVSGLAYGTHTVKLVAINTGAGGDGRDFHDFIIYGPKKPELPANSTELGSYNLMADFVAKTDGTGVGSTPVSQGTLSKYSTREYLYSGSWSMNFSTSDNATGGFTPSSSSGYLEYTAFCTGFEYRGADGGSAGTISINGSTDFTGSGLNTTETLIGGASFNESTGAFGGSNWQDGIAITGLPLGLHTFRMTATGVGSIAPISLAPIVPIHVPKADRNLLRDDLIGSNSLKSEVALPDFRKGKVYFPDGIETNFGCTVKEWTNSSDTTSIAGNTYLPDLSITDLVPGRLYEATAMTVLLQHSGSTESSVSWFQGSDRILRCKRHTDDSGLSYGVFFVTDINVFVAKTATLEARWSGSISPSCGIAGTPNGISRIIVKDITGLYNKK